MGKFHLRRESMFQFAFLQGCPGPGYFFRAKFGHGIKKKNLLPPPIHPHKNQMVAPYEIRQYFQNKILGSPYLGDMTKMAAMTKYGKNPLKIIFSGTKGPMSLGLGMQHWEHRPSKI